MFEIVKPKRHQLFKSKILGLSFKRDDNFLRNLVISFGIIFVRAGVWSFADKYIIKNSDAGRIACIIIGIFLLFLIDGDISKLGGNNKK